MKNILCYGDSNTWGCKPIEKLGHIERFGADDRWTGILSKRLGEGYQVIEEGLNARTTAHDDPIDGTHKNGRSYLLPCLESHVPLDLIIIMLGTNDLKSRFSLSAFDIASGIKPLLEIVSSVAPKNGGQKPQTLVVAPPPLARLSLLAEMFEGGSKKSNLLARHYKALASLFDCHFIDAAEVVTSSDVDGIHLDLDQHELLGEAIAARARTILSAS
ncbi:MAG: SGNH/GDSL hydrolase family protein [Rhizobiaceae bacterium]